VVVIGPKRVYIRATGENLGVFVARSVEEAVGLAIRWHGYSNVLERSGLESLPVEAFEVVNDPAG
jgi:hypothetical protein